MGIIQKQGLQNTLIAYFGALIGFVNKLFLLPKFFFVQQVGLINLLSSLSLLYAQFSSFGIYQSILKFFPNYQQDKKGAFLSLILIWMLVGFLIVSTIIWGYKDTLSNTFFQQSPLLKNNIHYLFPLTFCVLVLEVLDNYCKALLKSVFTSFIKDVLLRIFILIVIIPFSLNWISFQNFLNYFILSHALCALSILVYLLKIKELTLQKITIPNTEIKKIFRFSIYVLLTGASSIVITNIDAFMLSYYTGLTNVGIYTTMGFLVSAILIPYRSLAKISSPIIPQLWKAQQFKEIEKLYKQFSLNAFFVSATLFLLIYLNVELVFVFIDESYRKGFYVFIFIGLARLIDVLYGLNGVILMTSDKYWVDIIFILALILLTIISNSVFIPQYGMEGAVFASAISIVLINMVRGWYVKWYFKIALINQKLLLQLLFFSLIFTVNYFFKFDNLYLSILWKNSSLILVFILPVWHLNLASDIKQWVKHNYAKLTKKNND